MQNHKVVSDNIHLPWLPGRIEVILVGCFLVVVVLVTKVALQRVESHVRQQAVNVLETVRNSTHEAIGDIWVEGLLADATIWAANPELVMSTEELLTAPHRPEALLSSPAQPLIRSYFRERLKQHDAQGIFVIAPDYISLASMRDENIGTVNFIVQHRKEYLEMVFQGKPQFIPPLPSDVPLPDATGTLVAGYPTMFVAVPIKDEGGEVIAALTIRLDPYDTFITIVQTGRVGKSGETYVFDRNGRLLSESRFDDQLRSAGLLEREQKSVLNIQVRDPGGNLIEGYVPEVVRPQQPLTLMTGQGHRQPEATTARTCRTS